MPFKPGNNLGGRPKSKSRLEADKALEYIRKRVTEELEPILDKQISQAKSGDGNARKDLYDRAYGKPKETIEHQGLDFIFDEKSKLV